MKFIIEEINFIYENDPSMKSKLEVLITPCFKALIYYKISHFFYQKKLYFISRLISEKARRKTLIEIHPGAHITGPILIDHGCGVVIGETCIIGKYVKIYQGSTLGTNLNIKGKRHPTIEDNVLIGAGSIILGNVIIKKNSKVGAGAIVLDNVLENTTVVCEKAKIKSKKLNDFEISEIIKYL